MPQLSPDALLIGALLPQGVAAEVLARLRDEKQLLESGLSGARALFRLEPFAAPGSEYPRAVEILNVVVPADRAAEIYQFVCEAARIDRPDGGLLWLSAAVPGALLVELDAVD